MKITLRDYRGDPEEVDIGELENIGSITIKEVTGDEIAVVITKDYHIEEYDSSYDREADFLDASIEVYNSATGLNLLESKEFLNRTSVSDLVVDIWEKTHDKED